MSTDLNVLETNVKELQSDVKELKNGFFKASVLASAGGILVLGWLATTNFYTIPKAVVDVVERQVIKQFEKQAKDAAQLAADSAKCAADSASQIAGLQEKLQKEVASNSFKITMAGSQEVSTSGDRLGYSEWVDLPKTNQKQFVIASASIEKAGQELHYSPFVEAKEGRFRVKIHDIDGHPHSVTVRIDYLVIESNSLNSTAPSVAVSK